MSNPPVVDPPTAHASEDEHIVGVLLAAGRSTRFGQENKLLTEVDGVRLVRRALEPLLGSTLDDIVAVVGFEADRVAASLPSLECHRNREWQDGIGRSVALGARIAAEAGADAVLFALGDMPWIDSDSVEALLMAYRNGTASALAAAHRARRGNPVLFDRAHFDALAELDSTTGGNTVFQDCESAVLVETGDPGVRQDIDYPEDLDR